MNARQLIIDALKDFVNKHKPGDRIIGDGVCGLCGYIRSHAPYHPHLLKALVEFQNILVSKYIDEFSFGFIDVPYFATEKRIRIANEVIALLEKELADDRRTLSGNS